MRTHVNGVYAALLIPRDPGGALDDEAFRRSLEFLLARGITGVALNGATGEYCNTTPAEVERLLGICRETLAGRASFLCGIGSPSLDGAVALGRMAIAAGAAALLLPMPSFFRYSQDDLHAWAAAVAAALPAPILLYNLPKFTNPLEAPTVEALLDAAPIIIGMKDSSGSLELLRLLGPRGACRIVGDDGVLVRALDEGACDGVVSGVAGVLPELIRFLFYERQSPAYTSAVGLLAELIRRLSVFPTPWGLKLIAECRGLAPARFFQPLSEARRRQAREFQEWFGPWWAARRA